MHLFFKRTRPLKCYTAQRIRSGHVNTLKTNNINNDCVENYFQRKTFID